MIHVRLEEVNAENFNNASHLSVDDIQKEYLRGDPIFFIAESKFYPNSIPMVMVDDCMPTVGNKISLNMHKKNIAVIELYKSFRFEFNEVSFSTINEKTGITNDYYNMELLY
jgi:hypothetical protein